VAEHTLVEDVGTPDFRAAVTEDPDGFRVLHIDDTDTPVRMLPIRVWQRAYDAGVAMVVVGDRLAISTPDFLATRGEEPATQCFTIDVLHEVPPNPSYKDYIAREVVAESADPLENSKFVHLHTHFEYSPLDGLSKFEEAAKVIAADPHGGGALGSADHGTCAGHPEQQEVCNKFGIKPIFGM